MGLVQELVNYRMADIDSIRGAWIHLASLGRRIAEIDLSQAQYKKPDIRIKHLLAALPQAYRSTRTIVNA